MPSVPILELHLEVSVREDDKIYFLLTLKAQFMQTKVFREEEGGDVIKHLQRRQRRKEQMCSQNCTQNFVLANPCAQSSLNVGTELILNKPQKTSCLWLIVAEVAECMLAAILICYNTWGHEGEGVYWAEISSHRAGCLQKNLKKHRFHVLKCHSCFLSCSIIWL